MGELVIAIATLVITYYTGAITEAETDGSVTNSINYQVADKRECREYFPKIIITDQE